MAEVTELLVAIGQGDAKAKAALMPLVYQELIAIARRRMAHERADHTLQPTALVHEAYLRLVGPDGGVAWNSRGHFYAAAAEAMRRILVDQARQKKSQKRGGEHHRVDFAADLIATDARPERILALEEALHAFEQQFPQKAELVKLRFFAGLTIEQAAEAVGISTTTADRYWAYARAWLKSEMDEGESASAQNEGSGL
jgi:RNA polymerase sigma factor (TIGR02999 family)